MSTVSLLTNHYRVSSCILRRYSPFKRCIRARLSHSEMRRLHTPLFHRPSPLLSLPEFVLKFTHLLSLCSWTSNSKAKSYGSYTNSRKASCKAPKYLLRLSKNQNLVAVSAQACPDIMFTLLSQFLCNKEPKGHR